MQYIFEVSNNNNNNNNTVFIQRLKVL